MSEGSSQSENPTERLAELAHLPPHDPGRRELQSLLAALPPDERQPWLDLVQETDQLYAELSLPDMPLDMESRLLALPREQAARQANQPWWNRALQIQIGWPAAVAAAVAVIAVAGYLLWEPPARTVGPLNEQLAGSIAARAVENESSLTLEVASNDPKQVETALAAHRFAFPVSVLKPTVKLNLRGGGVCDFDGTPAAFTRWEGNGGVSYTVYQFNGAPLGVPASFLKTSNTPQALWHDNSHYRVTIWPGAGAPCTWAVVMDNNASADVFSYGY